MPNIKSAKKRVRVSLTKTLRRKSYMSSLRTMIKNALSEKSGTQGTAVKAAMKKLDQAVSKGILHKNAAARRKARIMRIAQSN